MFQKLNYIFTKSDKIKIFFLMIAIVIGSFLELLAVSIFSPFIDLIMSSDALDESSIISYIYHTFSFQDIEHFLAFLAGVIIVIYVVKDVYTIIEKTLFISFHIKYRERFLRIY